MRAGRRRSPPVARRVSRACPGTRSAAISATPSRSGPPPARACPAAAPSARCVLTSPPGEPCQRSSGHTAACAPWPTFRNGQAQHPAPRHGPERRIARTRKVTKVTQRYFVAGHGPERGSHKPTPRRMIQHRDRTDTVSQRLFRYRRSDATSLEISSLLLGPLSKAGSSPRCSAHHGRDDHLGHPLRMKSRTSFANSAGRSAVTLCPLSSTWPPSPPFTDPPPRRVKGSAAGLPIGQFWDMFLPLGRGQVAVPAADRGGGGVRIDGDLA
jgi:hypothetical protein